MLKDDFILMQKQDLTTNENPLLEQLLYVFEAVLKDYSPLTDVSSELTVEDCYHKMEAEAKRKAKNGVYCFGPEETKKFVISYLKLTSESPSDIKTKLINLEDFI